MASPLDEIINGLVDPNDMSFQYNTSLTPDEEVQYQQWLKQIGHSEAETRDYDLRGAFKANLHSDDRGHLDDTYKKPSHHTASNESIYSDPANPGGRWVGRGHTYRGSSQWDYYASPANMQHYSKPDMLKYFQQVEPQSMVYFPDG
jgi:hypothetical protein